jgi:hypothetical protein
MPRLVCRISDDSRYDVAIRHLRSWPTRLSPKPRHLLDITGGRLLMAKRARARSSAGEHSLHTGGVTGSIPVAPTTKAQQNQGLGNRPPPSPRLSGVNRLRICPKNGGKSGESIRVVFSRPQGRLVVASVPSIARRQDRSEPARQCESACCWQRTWRPDARQLDALIFKFGEREIRPIDKVRTKLPEDQRGNLHIAVFGTDGLRWR